MPLPKAFNADRDLYLERLLPLTIEQIWAAWTHPEHLVHWFCPEPWRLAQVEMDLRPGGIFRTVMEGPDGQVEDSTGCFIAVEPRHQLVITDALGPEFRPNGQGFMTFSIQLSPQPGGTLYRAWLRHQSPEARAEHEKLGFETGWNQALEQMLAYFQHRHVHSAA